MVFRNRFLAILSFAVILLIPVLAKSQEGNVSSLPRNDFKVTLLSLGSGSTRLTYERAFSPRHSGEITFGLVGLGWDFMNDSDPVGYLVKLAYKWRLVQQSASSSWLAGFYVKPEFVGCQFSYDHPDIPGAIKRTTQIALLAECGYQLVVKWFVFDVYSGLGPSVGTGNENNYYHSFMLFPDDGHLAFTAGFRIGVAF